MAKHDGHNVILRKTLFPKINIKKMTLSTAKYWIKIVIKYFANLVKKEADIE